MEAGLLAERYSLEKKIVTILARNTKDMVSARLRVYISLQFLKTEQELISARNFRKTEEELISSLKFPYCLVYCVLEWARQFMEF